MRLEFYDGDLNLLPGSIEFPAGGKNVDFTTPETVVRAKILIKSPGDGFPVIQVKEYRHPFASAFKWRGQWLWSQREWGPFYARVWFEKKFELKSAPEAALMAMVADDSADVFINGKFAGHAHPFWIPGKFDITKLLRPGKNTMTVRVYNGSQNAGVVVNCYIKTADSELYIDTDQSWKCEAKSNSQTIPSVIDQPVVELGDPNITMPWANRLGFRYAGEQGLLRRIDSKPGKLTVKIEKMPPCKVERLDFILRDEKNRQWKRQFAITPDSSQWKAGEVVTLSYPIPYINNGKYDLLLNDDYVYLLGDKKLYTFEQAPRPATQLAKAEFINRSTRPRLVMDGRTLNPAFWNSGTALGRDRFFELYLANEMGFDNFRVGTDFLKFWKGPGKYDFSDLDNSISYILTLNPNAVFTIHMHTHMPDWWLKLNPDDTSKCFNNQPRQRDRDKQALASKKWLRDADEPIKALVDFIKKQPYANRIWSVTIAENGNGEWFWWYKDDLRRPACSGFSAADHATFRMHLKRKYPNDQALQKAWKQPNVTLDTAMMPDPAKARKGRVGWLLDPAQDRQVMDWFEFRNLALAEALIELGGSVKRHTGGKWLVGAYYGYFTELIENGGLPLQITGHNGFYEVAKSPNVDFLFGPSRYTYRKTGMPDGLMHAWSTHQLNDKTMLCEQDMRTVYSNPSSAHDKMYAGTPDSSLESVGHINRAFGMMLATGTVNYWYDISGASFYERPFSQAIGKHNKVYKSLPDVKGLTPIETAVVCDRDSVYYTPNANISNVFSSAISGLFQHINKLAIPFRSLVVADLLDKNITVPAHKVYIMLPTLVLSQDQRAQLMQRFEREKATVIWLYAAGAFYPQAGPKAEYCGDFLQMKFKMIDKQFAPAMKAGNIECSNLRASSPWFYPVSGFDAVLGKDAQGQPMLVKKSLNGATHYFSTLMNLPVELYQDWLQAAGVRRYIKSIDDPVWAGNDVVFLYAKCPGRKIFDLPAGVRARSIIGPVKSTFSSGEGFEAQAGLTYGFLLER